MKIWIIAFALITTSLLAIIEICTSGVLYHVLMLASVVVMILAMTLFYKFDKKNTYESSTKGLDYKIILLVFLQVVAVSLIIRIPNPVLEWGLVGVDALVFAYLVEFFKKK